MVGSLSLYILAASVTNVLSAYADGDHLLFVMAPTKHVIEASLEEMPMTFVRRLNSALSRASGFVL